MHLSNFQSALLRRGSLLLFAVVLFFVGSCYLASNLLKNEEVLLSDYAADLLLERKIDDEGYLLTGHYSRFRFNHPGPFFFYELHAVHRIADHFGIAPCVSFYFATILLNGFFMTLGIYLAHRIVHRRGGYLSIAVCMTIIFSMIEHDVHTLWMPMKLILPLMAYMLSLALIVRRELRFFPLACFLACVLVHGYVSMVVLALPCLGLALWYALRSTGVSLRPGEPLYFVGGAAVCLLFLSPLLIDLLINHPSNVEKIVAAGSEHFKSPKFLEIIDSVGKFAFHGLGLIQLGILLTGSYALTVSSNSRSAWANCLSIFVGMYVIFVIYHRFVPGHMYTNMVLFMQGLLIALVVVCVLGLLAAIDENLASSRRLRFCVKCIFVLVVVMSVRQLRPMPFDFNQNKYVRDTASIIMLTTFKQGHAVIEYTDQTQWPGVAGVLLDLKLRNYKACTTRAQESFLFTPAQICQPEDKPNIRLTPVSRCGDSCNFRSGDIGIVILK